MIDIKPGTYRVIRVDGTEETIEQRPTIKQICKAICCDTVDGVRIGKNPKNGERDLQMLCDDDGIALDKPINPKATLLYHSIIRPEFHGSCSVRGDVVIALDRDFAWSEQQLGTCTQCGDPIYPSTAAFDGATKTCYDCWAVDDIGETGYEGDAS